MDTLHASVARVQPWLPWLAVTAAASGIWSFAHPEFPLDLFTTTVAAGRAILMVYLAVMWRRWRELGVGALVGLLGVVGWVGARLSLGWLPGTPDTLGAAGVALCAFLAYRAWRKEGQEAELGGQVAWLGLAYLLLTPTAIALAGATVILLPRAWDAPAYAIDHAAFPVHAFHVGRWLEHAPAVRWTSETVSEGIFKLLPALVALRLRLARPQATDLLVVCILTSTLGQLGYFLTPIVGPTFAFGDEFPDVLPHLERMPMAPLPVPPFLRNGMPSIHTAWALVFLWNTRPFVWPLRALGWFVVVFTVISTLGLGQHYVIDLVAAVPYAALTQALGTQVPPEGRRAKAIAVGACVALALLWIMLPHLAWGIAARLPWLVLLAALGTVIAAVVAERRVAADGRLAAP